MRNVKLLEQFEPYYYPDKDYQGSVTSDLPQSNLCKCSANFAKLYLELGTALGINKERLQGFTRLITNLDDITHAADALFDKNLGDSEKIPRLQILLQEPYAVNNALNELDLSKDPILHFYREGIDYLRAETKLKGTPFNTEEVAGMLKNGNPDFRLYNELFYKFSGENTLLRAFMEHYMEMDLICDHIHDIEEDAQQSFNLVLWKNSSQDYTHILEAVSYFADLGIKKGENALGVIKGKSKLEELLAHYAKGEITGLRILTSLDCFEDEWRRAKQKLTKPHPWERRWDVSLS